MANVPDSSDQDRREPAARQRRWPKPRPRTLRPDRRASPACSTNWTSRSSKRSCRTWRPSGTPDLDGVRARLFAFDDLPLLTQKARVLLFDGLSTELVTLALRGAAPATCRSGAVGDRRTVAAHDRSPSSDRARKAITSCRHHGGAQDDRVDDDPAFARRRLRAASVDAETRA